MNAASIPPDTVAIPETMTAWISDRVIRSRYGATTSGASVWPMKTFAAAVRVSAPLVPRVRTMTFAIPTTASWRIPR